MPSKIEGNENENTVQVKIENVTANGKSIKNKGSQFKVGGNCDVTFE